MLWLSDRSLMTRQIFVLKADPDFEPHTIVEYPVILKKLCISLEGHNKALKNHTQCDQHTNSTFFTIAVSHVNYVRKYIRVM